MRSRVILLLPVLAVCAWWALAARQAHDTAAARAILDRRGDPAAVRDGRTAERLLGRSALLNPDAELDILRARAEILEGRLPAAQRLLRSVVAREPQNFDGWVWLAGSEIGDPRAARRALAQIRALDPRA